MHGLLTAITSACDREVKLTAVIVTYNGKEEGPKSMQSHGVSSMD